MAIIIMAIWPLFMPVADSVVLMPIVSVISVLIILVRTFRFINFKLLIIPTVFSFSGLAIGLRLMLSFDNTIMIRILGGVLIGLAIYFFFFSAKIKIPNNYITAVIAGLISGVLNGLVNIAGPPIVLYYSVATKDKNEYMGTIQAFTIMNIVFRLILYLFIAKISPETVIYMPYAVVSAVLGVVIGTTLFRKLRTESIRKFTYITMLVMGIWYMLGGTA